MRAGHGGSVAHGSAGLRYTPVLPRVIAVPGENGQDGTFSKQATQGGRTSYLGTFFPRGVNYVDLSWRAGGHAAHSTFSEENHCLHLWEKRFQELARNQYNIIRVFIYRGDGDDPTGINGDPHGTQQLDPDYVRRVAGFVGLASAYGLYTLPVLAQLPANDWFTGELARRSIRQPAQYAPIESPNLIFLDRGYLELKQIYLELFIDGLKHWLGEERVASNIFAYDLENEIALSRLTGPFSFYDRYVRTTVDAYSMPTPEGRQSAVDDNVRNFFRIMKGTLTHLVDEQALLSAAFAPFGGLGMNMESAHARGLPADSPSLRFPIRPEVLMFDEGGADILDMHIYPCPDPLEGSSLQQLLDSSGWDSMWADPNQRMKPTILFELGAWRGWQLLRRCYLSLDEAADSMIGVVRASSGHHFQGTAQWTYDTTSQTEVEGGTPRLWGLTDSTIARDGSTVLSLGPAMTQAYLEDLWT
jgi:hypothetical protein